MKRILIAGGAGFIGSHLCEHYLEQGEHIYCVDNLSTGAKRNIEHLENNNRFNFVQKDICDGIQVEESIDVVINLASPASPPHYQRLSLETLEAGSIGTRNLLELTKQHDARFLQASTSEVYGDPEVHPQPEEYKGSVNCYGPRSMYDEAKRYSEALVYAYHEKYGLNTSIARFFNTYGPRMDPRDGRVVSNFIVQALNSEPITIYGDGSQTRSFCHVDDLIEGIVKLVESDIHEPINLGNPGEFTVIELAQVILRLTDSASEVTFMPLPQDDPLQRKPVITKAKTGLEWEPTVQLEEGLERTIKYFASLSS